MYTPNNILITGGLGMIGSNLVKRLVLNEGYKNKLFIVDNGFKGDLSNIYNNKSLIDTIQYFNLDLTVPDVLDDIIIKNNIDTVIHLAYVIGGIGFILNNEGLIFRKNILINSNVINSIRNCSNNIKAFINITSACSFPKNLQVSIDSKLVETDLFPANPESSYGWTKLMGAYETELMSKETGVKSCNLIFHNIYGSPTNFNNNAQVLPSLVYKVISCPDNGTVTVWGSGNQGRAFVYVDDAVDSIVRAMKCGIGHGYIQIGPDYCVTIKDVINIIIKKSNKNINVVYDITKPEGDKGRCADYTKAKEILGWEPQTTIEEGINKLYDWINIKVSDSI